MITTINELSDYFNRNKFPCVVHQVGKNIFDVFIMEENYTKIVFDLEWELQSQLEIRFQPLKSKSEFRRINSMFSGVDKCGLNLKSHGELLSKKTEEISGEIEGLANSSPLKAKN